MNEKDKIVKRIINIEERIWIPMSVSKKEELIEYDVDRLKKYLRAVEIVNENSTKHNPQYTECDTCKKYMSNVEVLAGTTCYDCKGINWY